MNKKEISVLILLFLVSTILTLQLVKSYVNDSSIINVSVNLKQPTAEIQITPDTIPLGEITIGYDTNFTNITFTNIGTLPIKIFPLLQNGTNKIFNYLEFNTANCSTTSSRWYNITHYNSGTELLFIDKPDIYQGQKSDSACIRLGLDNYNDTEITSDLYLSTNLIIWIFPA